MGFSGSWNRGTPPSCTALLLAALLSASRPCPTWTRLGPASPSGLPTSLLCRAAPPRTPRSLMPLSVSLCSQRPPDGPADLPHLLSPKPPSACCVPGTGGRASSPQGPGGPGPQRPQATPGTRMHGVGTQASVDTPRDPHQWAAGQGQAERDRKWRSGVGWARWQEGGRCRASKHRGVREGPATPTHKGLLCEALHPAPPKQGGWSRAEGAGPGMAGTATGTDV